MANNIFVDIAEIDIFGGKGGDGRVSFRREKFIPKGGPDGGDGGNGGSVVLQADSNMATLMDFRAKPKYEAEKGEAGGTNNKTGAGGEDLVIRVPVGTLVHQIEADGGTMLVGDLTKPGEELRIARGGMGGKGNSRFKSSRNRTPEQHTPGTEGEHKRLKLEIKLLADVGLIGLPNAGKSTLINQIAGTRAKVASYPFTTLNPNLGVCQLPSGQRIIIADIPGLIEGAAQGKGLGDDFLRHIERTRMLVHVIDPMVAFDNLGSTADLEKVDLAKAALGAYEDIRSELKAYSDTVFAKKELVVINKIDVTEVREAFPEIKQDFESRGVEVMGISALTGAGIQDLLLTLMHKLEKIPEAEKFTVSRPVKVYTINDLPNKRLVFRGR